MRKITILLTTLLTASTLFAATPQIGEEHGYRPVATRLADAQTALAGANGRALLAWSEADANDRPRVHIARLALNGRMLDTPIAIPFGHSSSNASLAPVVASDGSEFFVVWQERSADAALPNRIFGTRVDRSGQLGAAISFGFLSITAPRMPRVTWDGHRYQVFAAGQAWHVRRDGTVASVRPFVEPDTVAALNSMTMAARFSSERSRYACRPVGLSLFCSTLPDAYIIDWSLIDPAGTARGQRVQAQYTSSFPPAIEADTDEFLMAWKTPAGIDALRVHPDGSAAGYAVVPMTTPLTGTTGPQVAFDGARYLIVYDMGYQSRDIWAAEIVPDRTYVGEPFLISAAAGRDEIEPRVEAVGSGQFLVTYVSRGGTSGERIVSRLVSFSAPVPSRRRSVQ